MKDKKPFPFDFKLDEINFDPEQINSSDFDFDDSDFLNGKEADHSDGFPLYDDSLVEDAILNKNTSKENIWGKL